MTRHRLVVAGGGLAGLLAAAAAAAEFDEVLVVDHARFADGSVGAPQTAQLHNVLTRGQRHLEELLPGFREQLLAGGAEEGSVADHTHVFEYGGAGAERPLGLSIWSTPLSLLWSTARALLPGNVRLLTGEVDSMTSSDGTLRNVTINADTESLAKTDVSGFVDATGYASAGLRLLAGAGAQLPEVEERRLDRWFVTVRTSRPPSWRGARDFWMTFTEPPARDVALLSPASKDEWILSVSSEDGRRPPRDWPAIMAFLERLPGPELRPLVDDAAPVAPLSHFRRKTVRWQHYERIREPVEGFVALGDAFATINPVYGQGVGVAAWQAALLRESLRAEGLGLSWTRRYLGPAGAAAAQAWALDDVPVPFLPVPTWVALARRLAIDSDMQRRYVGLWHLVEPTSTLAALGSEVTGASPGDLA